MNSTHYPEQLLRDYELLLRYFPSHILCRPPLVEEIKRWKEDYSGSDPVSILEIGPGYGETTELILAALPAALTLVETDTVAATLLRSNLEKYGQPFTIVEADATKWIRDQPSESFDVFTASWTLHNFPEPERDEFLEEVRRMLRPQGLFVIFDKVLPDNPTVIAEMWRMHTERLAGLDAIGRPDLKKDMLAHEERDAEKPYAWYEHTLYARMQELGFTNSSIVMRNERDIVFSAIRS